jgi:hypothetical protein
VLAIGSRAVTAKPQLLQMQQETSDEAQQGGLAMPYHALGRKADSDAALARMLREQADGDGFASQRFMHFVASPRNPRIVRHGFI